MRHEWSFSNIRVAATRLGLENVIVGADYRLAYTEDDARWEYAEGTVELPAPSEETFISFTQVTEEDMVEFVEQALGAEEVDAIKSRLYAAYSDHVSLVNPPWVANQGEFA